MAFYCILHSMKSFESLQFALPNFQGPLDLLLYLVQRGEVDIHNLELQKITGQYLEREQEALSLEQSSAFINDTGYLLWLKSRTLLPLKPQEDETVPEEPDPHFEIIHHLVDYCRFKEAAKILAQREEEQNDYFPRGGIDHPHLGKPLGLDHLSLEDLALLFNQILSKASAGNRIIKGETWILADVIKQVLHTLQLHQKIGFTVLFSHEKVREELIVTFLAVLELMKEGKILVVRDKATNEVLIKLHGT